MPHLIYILVPSQTDPKSGITTPRDRGNTLDFFRGISKASYVGVPHCKPWPLKIDEIPEPRRHSRSFRT
jgi:hypothetical protein